MRLTRLPLLRAWAIVLGAVAALLAAAPAAAQEAATEEVGSGVASFGLGDWLDLGLRLVLVVAVIWGAVYAMRWYVRRVNRGVGRSGARALEVIETHALGPNRTLHLVRLGDRAVLVGATQERITQLLTVDDPDEFKRLTERPDDGGVASTPRIAGAMSLMPNLGSGLKAMRVRQAEMNARIKAHREAQREAQRGTQRETGAATAAPKARGRAGAAQDAEPRFGSFKGILGRRAAERAPRSSEAIIEEAAAERESLFDRALASIDAIEVMPNGSIAAGARARASYGTTHPAARAASSDGGRESQIAELQRAIAAARKSAS